MRNDRAMEAVHDDLGLGRVHINNVINHYNTNIYIYIYIYIYIISLRGRYQLLYLEYIFLSEIIMKRPEL